mmetsp:Transcript_12614/g.38975  ORF Transcript_12614/g.38975 Transcript_12614/m.38975 type:complete len:207 (-) Transcript_12614:152-772(-)
MSGASRMRDGFVGTGRASAAVRAPAPSSLVGSAMTSSADRKRSGRASGISAEKRKIFPVDDEPAESSRPPGPSSDGRPRRCADRGRSADRIARRNSTSTGRALPGASDDDRGASVRESAWFASSKSIDVRFGMKRSEDGVRAGDVPERRGVRGGVRSCGFSASPARVVLYRFEAGDCGVSGGFALFVEAGGSPNAPNADMMARRLG